MPYSPEILNDLTYDEGLTLQHDLNQKLIILNMQRREELLKVYRGTFWKKATGPDTWQYVYIVDIDNMMRVSVFHCTRYANPKGYFESGANSKFVISYLNPNILIPSTYEEFMTNFNDAVDGYRQELTDMFIKIEAEKAELPINL